MSSHPRKIARLITNHAKSVGEQVAQSGKTKIGTVASVAPIAIQPLGGSVALPAEALLWSNTSLITRDRWAVGDTVSLSMIDGDTYLVHDLMQTGTIM